MTYGKQGGALLLLALLSLPHQVFAAQSPFDIDVKELDRAGAPSAPKAAQPSPSKGAPSRFDIDVKELEHEGKGSPAKAEKKKAKKEKKTSAGSSGAGKTHKAATGDGEYVRYTVKPGDHIFKILVTRFGMSNEAAEKLIPEIVRINDISNIKSLTVGRTLLIPTGGHHVKAARSTRSGKHHGRETEIVQPETGTAAQGGATAPVAKLPETVSQAVEKAPAQAAAPAAVPPAPKPAAPAVPTAPVAKVPSAPAATAKVAPTAPSAPTPSAAPAVPKAAPKVPVPAPAPAAPLAAAAQAAPVAPVAPAAVLNTWICSITDKDPAKIVDSAMSALSLHWSKNRIINSAEGAPNAFSIRVDRYFERNGARYIVSIDENDPYSFTLLRLLETSGYRVLMIGAGDDFKAVTEKLLRMVGLTPDFGKHPIQGGRESTGFLVQQEDAEGRRLLLTGEAVDPKSKWTLPQGCGYR